MEGVAATKALLDRFDEVSAKFGDPDADMDALMAEQAELQEQIDAVQGWELQRTLDIAMDALRCPPGDQDVATLSGGERRRVALCRLLLQQPDLLLLDEPTNHLDAESVAWLERHLLDYPGTVVAITHDRYFLDNVAGWILELDRGHGIPWQGNYSSWLEQKQKRLAQEEKQELARQQTLARELEWIRASPRARQAKSKARITAYEDLLSEAQERTPGSAQIMIPPGPRLGDVVIEAEHLGKGYGDAPADRRSRLPPAARRHRRRDRAERRRQDHAVSHDRRPGAARRRRSTRGGHGGAWLRRSEPRRARREQIGLGGDLGGRDTIQLGKREVNSRAYVAAFNFRGPDQQQKVGQLSGGERNRVHLAKLLKGGANVILLDEPTNDLDVDTLRALEDALLDFAGCAVIISHDRWFLDRIATHILAFEGDSHVEWFEGNYQDYEADRKRRLGAEADQPHRIKYKPLKVA